MRQVGSAPRRFHGAPWERESGRESAGLLRARGVWSDPVLRNTYPDDTTRAKAAGEELAIAPLSEVGRRRVVALRDDVFWATVPTTEGQTDKLRARTESQIQRTLPECLLETNLMMRSAEELTQDCGLEGEPRADLDCSFVFPGRLEWAVCQS